MHPTDNWEVNVSHYYAVVGQDGTEYVSAGLKRQLKDDLTCPEVLWQAQGNLPVSIQRFEVKTICDCEDWLTWDEDEVVSIGMTCPFCGLRIDWPGDSVYDEPLGSQ